jgi:hypothetical protein
MPFSEHQNTKTIILRLYRLFTTLSYYGENGRKPNNTLSKIARRRRRQLDPSRCSWNVQTLTFHFYKIQISKSLWKSEVQTRFLFGRFDFVHSQNDILRMTFSDYIDYSHTLSYYGENSRKPNKHLSKIAMYQRYQPDPSRCSENVLSS